MLSEGILIAIITGGFTLLGTIIQTYKCFKKTNYDLLKPYNVLNVRYEPPNLKNADKYIDIKKGNYKIKVPHGLRMMPSNTTGIVNVFKEFDSNFGDCVLEVNITKIRGDVDLFVKRFNNKWDFVNNDPITTYPVDKGYNKMSITSRIGSGEVEREQIGLMVYSKDIEYLDKCCLCRKYNKNCKKCKNKNMAICNINGANIKNAIQ